MSILIATPAFTQLIFGSKLSDFETHISFVQQAQRTGDWPLYSLFYLVIGAFTLGYSDPIFIGILFLIVLTLLVALKNVITLKYFQDLGIPQTTAAALTVVLSIAMPIANWWRFPHVYLGQISPTVWHNSTTIFALPFAMLAFFAAVRWLRSPQLHNTAQLAVAIFIGTLAKPNYAIALVPGLFAAASALSVQATAAKIKQYACGVLAAGAAVTVIGAVQYFSLKSNGPSNSHIVVAPFRAWSEYSPNILASLVLSIAFPAAVSAFYFRSAKNNDTLIFAWIVFAVSILQLVLFAETGERASHFNFAWGPYMANYILFVTSAAELFKHRPSAKFAMCLLVLGLHAVTGALFYFQVASGQWFL